MSEDLMKVCAPNSKCKEPPVRRTGATVSHPVPTTNRTLQPATENSNETKAERLNLLWNHPRMNDWEINDLQSSPTPVLTPVSGRRSEGLSGTIVARDPVENHNEPNFIEKNGAPGAAVLKIGSRL